MAAESASAIAEALKRVAEELTTAERLLREVYGIGLWSKSDDSSDNRRKREGLREVDWAISGALRALTSLNEIPPALSELERELRSLLAVAEPLPATVTDTMGENLALDSAIMSLCADVERLRQQATQLAG